MQETYRYAGDLGDWLHALDTAYADLRYPEGTADVSPLVARACALHGTSSIGAKHTLGALGEGTGPAQPRT